MDWSQVFYWAIIAFIIANFAFGAFTAFTLFFTFFYPEIIVPLFNKQTPLEQGELRDAIESFARDAGFELEIIYVMDESKRTIQPICKRAGARRSSSSCGKWGRLWI